MNTEITLTNKHKIDVRDVIAYSVDAIAGEPVVQCQLFLKGNVIMDDIKLEDLDCIEVYRRELRQIERDGNKQ